MSHRLPISVLLLCSAPVLAQQVQTTLFDRSSHDTIDSLVEGNLKENAGTHPQFAIGAVIEDICPGTLIGRLNVGADLKARCDELWLIGGVLRGAAVDGDANRDRLRSALQAMAPEEGAVIASSEIDTKSGGIDTVNARIAAVRGGVAGTPLAQLQPGRPIPMGMFGAGDSGLTGNAYVGFDYGTQDRDPTDRESGFDGDSWGITAGVDYQVRTDWLVGAAFSYHSDDVEIDASGGGLESDAYGVNGYLSYFPGGMFHVDATAGYTRGDHSQQRNVIYAINQVDVANFLSGCLDCVRAALTSVDQTARSSMNSDELSFSLLAGWDYNTSETWMLGSYLKFDYADVSLEGYQETMSNPAGPGSGLALIVAGRDYTSAVLAVGATLTGSWGARVYPFVTAEYGHEFENDAEPILARFVDDPNNQLMDLPTDDPDRNYFNLGAGFNLLLSDTVHLFARYQGLVGYSGLDVHVIEAGLNMQF